MMTMTRMSVLKMGALLTNSPPGVRASSFLLPIWLTPDPRVAQWSEKMGGKVGAECGEENGGG